MAYTDTSKVFYYANSLIITKRADPVRALQSDAAALVAAIAQHLEQTCQLQLLKGTEQ